MSSVTFKGVVKRYGDFTALQPLNLEILEGEFVSLLGPSGCGKTTTLRLIAGFIAPSEGTIFLGDTEITHLAPQERHVGMVFQDYALFPHLTIAENIAFGLVERRVSGDRTRMRVRELLELIELSDIGDRYPAQISGGQRQRVAVARAVAYAPRVLLMDEPLGALDLKLRETMQVELRRIQQELGITAVYVTHDQYEAMNMSDRIAVMNHGVLEQVGTAEEIYERPSTRFVAGFIGQINLLDGRIVAREGDLAVVEACGTHLRAHGGNSFSIGDLMTAAIRPERVTIVRPQDATSCDNQVPAQIESINFGGNLLRATLRTHDGARIVGECRPSEMVGTVGESVVATWNGEDTLILSE